MPKDSIPDNNAQEKGQSGAEPENSGAGHLKAVPDDPPAPAHKIASVGELPAVREYLNRVAVGDWKAGLKSARIEVQRGNYPQTVARVRFTAEFVGVTVPEQAKSDYAPEAFSPTEAEEAQIKAAMAAARFFERTAVQVRADRPLPGKGTEPIEDARAKGRGHYFEFHAKPPSGADDRNGNWLEAVQIRVERDERKRKQFIVYTYWEDRVWRAVEPEQLPVWNAHRLKDAGVVFLHEGAGAAEHCQWMADGATPEARAARDAHPWRDHLCGADVVHVGWIGGATNPWRTDWSVFAKAGVKHVYIVPDNDDEGRGAVKPISQALKIKAEKVMFTPREATKRKGKQGWVKTFDLGDDPAKGPEMWPPFKDVLEPATWMARAVRDDKGKVVGAALTAAVKDEWAYLRDDELLIHKQHRRIQHTPQSFDRGWCKWCDAGVSKPANLFMKADDDDLSTWTYRPGGPGVLALPGGGRAFNRYVPGPILPQKGDPGPWLEFVEYLVPDEADRKNLKRWIATFVARPEVRMTHGVLAISETQGTGKTTLTDCVLKPLAGAHNTSEPTNEDIKSQFNSWAARKRLVVVREIYQERSWATYHSMKDLTADNSISINEKNRTAVTVENWCHVFASSNSMNALKIDDKDRRWFIPEITEVPWPRSKFGEFRQWLNSGGLAIIAQWAEDFGDYVEPGENAPPSIRKAGIVEESRGEAAKALLGWLRDIAEPPEAEGGEPEWEAPCVSFSQVKRWALGFGYLKDGDVRKMLRLAGFVPDPDENAKNRRPALFEDRQTNHTIWGLQSFWDDLDGRLRANGELKGFVEKRIVVPVRPEPLPREM